MPGTQRTVGGYRLLRRLGSGGMGTVHEAVDAEGRHVAVKVLHPAIGADPNARRRLAREVALLHRVRDAGVARVLDAETDGDEAFVVTELIDGPTLDEDVAADGPFNPEELSLLARGLADALRAIHAVGVVHRDFKPSNVMMSEHGPVVIDFGIAQVADDARLTQTGLVTGTPGYLDPQIIAGAEPSPVCDWWGWAAVLVFAATGRPPFGRGPTEAVMARVATGEVDTDGLPEATAQALRAALAPRPGDRLDPDDVLQVLSGAWGTAELTQVIATSGATAATGPAASALDPATAVMGAASSSNGHTTSPMSAATHAVEMPTAAVGTPASHPGAYGGLPPTVPADAAADEPGAWTTRALPDPGRASATRTMPVQDRPSPQELPPVYHPGGDEPATRQLPAVQGAAGYLPQQHPRQQYEGEYPTAPIGYAPPGGGHDRYGPPDPVFGPGYGVEPFEHGRPDGPPAADPWDAPMPSWAVEPRRRTFVVLVVGLTMAALTPFVPGVFLIVAATFLLVTATVGFAGRSRRASRVRKGKRPGDDARMLVGLPWHLVRGVVAVVPGAVVGVLAGVATWWLGSAVTDPRLTGAVVLWIAGFVAIATAWLTPTSKVARLGARAMVDVLTPTLGFRTLLVVLLLAVATLAAVQVMLSTPVPDWRPFTEQAWMPGTA